jgi:DMSO reductase family type II enzyme heme b subunit
MRARYHAGLTPETLLDADADVWKGVRPEPLELVGTPLVLQPTAAIQVAWSKKSIGAVRGVWVAALCDAATLAFRLEWDDPTENRAIVDTVAFPDGAAIVLPSAPGAPLVTMGAPGQAVNAWYWRADEEKGRNVVAEGIGTSRTADAELVAARGTWKGGRWRVVIARALRVRSTESVAQLEPGQRTQFGVAVWEGSHGERAGLKAFSGDWRELLLDAPPAARR